ncbi:hypothetical protein A3Q56_07980 [Intoshia linei]|uniref:Uncharacterized protein n=1 Tax=Intoshia linei TaxID=1819745 RepID=A0A177ASE2_9BILA|nr:hypothetical protein A3Q56_07980 [Intoshia linei]
MPMNLDDFHMLNVSQKKHLFECKVKELNCTTQNSQKFTRNNSFNLNSNVKNSVKIKKLQKSNTVKYRNRKTKIFENNFSLFDCSVDVAKTSNITKKNSQSSTIDFNFLDCNKTRTFHDIPENTNEYEDSVYHLDNENMNTHEINRYSFINSSFTGSNKNKGGISTCSTISCNADNYGKFDN